MRMLVELIAMSSSRKPGPLRTGVKGAPRVVARHSASFSSKELYEAAKKRAQALDMKLANYLEYAVAVELGLKPEMVTAGAPAQQSLLNDDDMTAA